MAIMAPWRQDSEVVADCDAFLEGTYAERLRGQDRSVPTWAWLNLLAHGALHLLDGERTSIALDGGPCGRWPAARRFLTGEVLHLVRGDAGHLRALQSAVLWPWELDVAQRADARSWSPKDLVVLTTGALAGRVHVRP